MEVVAIILTSIGILVSGVAAWAAICSVVLTKRGLETQQEQLRLQREQASMIPDLDCYDVRLLDPASVEEVVDTLQEADKGMQEEERKKAEREQYERELAAWKVRKSIGGMGSLLPRPQNPQDSPLRFYDRVNLDPLTSAQRSYRGPVPDAVLEVEVHNRGRTAARDITGFISLDKSILELLDFPGLDTDEVSGPNEEGFLTAEVSVIGELLPKQTDSFRLAVSIHWPSEETVTKLRYDVLTPAGHTAVGERELTILGPAFDESDEQAAD